MATFTAANAAQLVQTLSRVGPGDTVLLAAGNYGALNLSTKFGGEVTIRSASPSNPAVFTSLDLDGASNLTFDGVKFDLVSGSAGGSKPFSVDRSSNITIRNADFDGQLVGGFGIKQGLMVTKSSNITVENSEFSDFYYGAGFNEVTNLKFMGNELTGMAFDGTRFAQIVNGLIAGNHFHDMRTAENGGHRDMIQFWTEGDSIPSSNVTIRDNIITIDDNYRMQAIFIFNEQVTRHGDGKEMYYKNFVIENNHIEGNHPHGILVGPIDGLVVRGNTVLRDPDNPYSGSGWFPKIDIDRMSTNVTITGNLANEITSVMPGWTVSGNKLVPLSHDPSGPSTPTQPTTPGGGGSSPPSSGALVGTGGADSLTGTSGDNVLRGMAGNDVLAGGAGRDQLIGGAGDDIFRFLSISDSTSAGHDAIRAGDGAPAFSGAGAAGGDRIDLSAIDANALVAGNQAFVFGSAATGGFVLEERPNSNTLLRANTDGDAGFEFELILEDGGLLASQYRAVDFIL